MDAILRAFQADPESVGRLLDFLPYPFLLAIKEEGGHFNRFINKRFQEEIGFTLDEISTIDDWFDYAYPDEEYRNAVKEAWELKVIEATKKGADSVFSRVRIHTRTKGLQWYEIKSTLSGDFELVAFVNVNDVIERDLELERINENKNRILSILGHDLRSPIVNLNKLTEFMMHSDLEAHEFMDHVHRVHELSKMSIQFLETTLIWTRSNFERVTPKRDKINLHDWLDKLLLLYQFNTDQKKLEFIIDCPVDLVLITDAEILHIVLRNLLTNAIKFSESNTKVRVAYATNKDRAVITVIDTGIGMEQDIIESIMNDQFDASQVSRLRGGFGIGLRLCKEVLKGIGGELEIVSKLNQGTKASVSLPLV